METISDLQKELEKLVEDNNIDSGYILRKLIENSPPEDLEGLSREVQKLKKDLKKNKKTSFSVILQNPEDGSVSEMKHFIEDPEDIEEALRTLRKVKKDTKNVKSTTVTQGKAEDYDIEKVLKSLEIEENPTKKRKPKSKRKSKKKPNETIIADNDSELTESVKAEDASVELVDSTSDEAKSSPNVNDVEDNECTICFCVREKTFVIIPCGHATFCEHCSLRICNDTKRCPTCQTPSKKRLRIFQ